MPFWKFQGVGNDFLVVPAERAPMRVAELARRICDRRLGIGADGLLLVHKLKKGPVPTMVRIINADGSEAEISGNGIRCVGAYLLAVSRRSSRQPLLIRTLAGTKELIPVEVGQRRWVFRVDMGKPVLDPAKIPFQADRARTPVCGFHLPTSKGTLPVTVTSMGNPHCSIFVEDFDKIDWVSLGEEIERKPHFPRGTNVEFIKVVSKREIQVRYWERGVGVTLSSGTGSCGATVASILNGHTGRRVRVRTLAGTMEVEWRPGKSEDEDEPVYLTGPVELIASGDYWLNTERSGKNRKFSKKLSPGIKEEKMIRLRER
ncbi:MAG: diaminopimelate epimerase [Acidobacteria bacterium]|nr:diaminopimelate epimerase [Acidobacteriota bacterium]